MSRRPYTIARTTERDLEITMAFNAAGSVPLPECKCRRSSATSATSIGGTRTDIQYMAVVVCNGCRGYRPLGPSDEAPVTVEVRAAYLSDLAYSHATTSESHGWEICRRDSDLPPGMEEDAEYLAGYLGRVIFEHGREQESAGEPTP